MKKRGIIFIALIIISLLSFVVVFVAENITKAEIKTGVMGWWKFDDASSANPADSSGQGNNASTTTMVAGDWVAGKVRTALSFPGLTGASARYVSIPRSSSLNLSTALTLCAWMYPRAGTNNGIIHKGTLANGQPDYGFGISTTNRILFRLNGAASDVNSTNNSLPFNTWTHACGTYDKVKQILYINGMVNNSTTFSANITDTANSQVFVGVYYSSSYTFNGNVDDVRIYNRALSSNEVKELYAWPRRSIGSSLIR